MKDTTTKEAIVAEVARIGTGYIDSHKVAKVLGAEVTYVQHVLREALHVCRYNVGEGVYRVHEAEACTDSCQDHGTGHKGPEAWNNGICCGIALPVSGECGYCS